MQGGICAAADGTVYDQRIAKCCRSHDIRNDDIFFNKLHDATSCLARIAKNVGHGGRGECGAGQCHTESFCHALHGACRTEEGAGTDGRTAGQVVIADFLRGNGIFALLSQRDVACHKACGLVWAGTHAAARDKDGRNVHAGGCFQVSRDGFVAAAGQDHAVPRYRACVDFYHICNGFTGCENNVHTVMSLRASVTDVGGVVVCRETAFFKYADFCLLGELVKMDAAGMRIAVHILNHDLRLFDVGVIPAASHLKGIELRPPETLFGTFLLHREPP